MACLLMGHISCALSAIVKDDVFVKNTNSYSYTEVCRQLTLKDSPLIEFHSVQKLDCMGTVVDVGKFCRTKQADDPYFLRGFVDKKEKKVKCLSGTRVTLAYACEGADDQYCKDKEIGCYLMQDILAHRLDLTHSALIEKNMTKELHCYFSTKNDFDSTFLQLPTN